MLALLSGIITSLGTGGVALIVSLFVVLFIFTQPEIDWKNKKISFRHQRKRACKDCIQLLMAKRTAFETLYTTKLNSILRNQMTYAEHKLREIEFIVKYELNNWVHREIKRSMLENGFAYLSDNDYTRYKLDRIDVLYNLINPSLTTNPEIDKIIHNIYDYAKVIKINTEKEIKDITKQFEIDIYNLIKA